MERQYRIGIIKVIFTVHVPRHARIESGLYNGLHLLQVRAGPTLLEKFIRSTLECNETSLVTVCFHTKNSPLINSPVIQARLANTCRYFKLIMGYYVYGRLVRSLMFVHRYTRSIHSFLRRLL